MPIARTFTSGTISAGQYRDGGLFGCWLLIARMTGGRVRMALESELTGGQPFTPSGIHKHQRAVNG